MIERVEDASEVVVGKTYDVPVIEFNDQGIGDAYFNGLKIHISDFLVPYVPIIGTIHSDIAYGFGISEHAHYDFRFVQKVFWDSLTRTGKVQDSEYSAFTYIKKPNTPEDGVVLFAFFPQTKNGWKLSRKSMRCIRPAPDMKISQVGFMVHTLQEKFKDCKIDPKNPVCPHRKASLRGAKEENGCLVCPCHGLRWNKKTGEIKKLELPQYCKRD